MDYEELMKMYALLKQDAEERDDSAQMAYLEKINQLPPELKAKAIADLSRSYEERRGDLRSELTRNYDTLAGAGPQVNDGPSGNPFAYQTAANPLEHLASGINKYMAGRDSRSQKDQLEELNKAEERQRGGMMQAWSEALTKKKDEEEGWWMRYPFR